jgi:hypothetical protein
MKEHTCGTEPLPPTPKSAACGYRPRLSKSEQLIVDKCRANYKANIVGVIGDLHEPFCHDEYFDFVVKTLAEAQVTEVVFIGDIVDQHAISYHDSDPDGFSAGHELKLAKMRLQKWYDAFPVAKVCIGNHDHLPARKALSNGIPKAYIRTLDEVLEAPVGWILDWSFDIDGVNYFHGTGFSGMYAHVNAMKQKRKSVCMGHLHSNFGIEFSGTEHDLLFGMAVGCGVDRHSYAAAYGRDFPRKPILGCATVTDGITPSLYPMPLSELCLKQ